MLVVCLVADEMLKIDFDLIPLYFLNIKYCFVSVFLSAVSFIYYILVDLLSLYWYGVYGQCWSN